MIVTVPLWVISVTTAFAAACGIAIGWGLFSTWNKRFEEEEA